MLCCSVRGGSREPWLALEHLWVTDEITVRRSLWR
jgi:hypothetical protein